MVRTQRHISSARRTSVATGESRKKMPVASLLGRWHIVEMSEWDMKGLKKEGQPYISVKRSGAGEFQFGLTEGSLCGSFKRTPEGALFDFTWAGCDECDPAFGDGWIRMKDARTAEGEIRFHAGDVSRFCARRAAASSTGKMRRY